MEQALHAEIGFVIKGDSKQKRLPHLLVYLLWSIVLLEDSDVY